VTHNLYLIGRILKPQGIRGEVKVDPVSEQPDRFERLKKVQVGDEHTTVYTIESVRIFKRFALIKFHEINDRNGAERLREKGVFVSKAELLSPGPDEYYIHDLIGCRIDTAAEQNVATVTNVLQGTGNDVLVIKDYHDREVLVPMVKEAIEKVDIEKKIIIVRSLETYGL
jgi:16S rRNA processing protein RimM